MPCQRQITVGAVLLVLSIQCPRSSAEIQRSYLKAAEEDFEAEEGSATATLSVGAKGHFVMDRDRRDRSGHHAQRQHAHTHAGHQHQGRHHEEEEEDVLSQHTVEPQHIHAAHRFGRPDAEAGDAASEKTAHLSAPREGPGHQAERHRYAAQDGPFSVHGYKHGRHKGIIAESLSQRYEVADDAECEKDEFARAGDCPASCPFAAELKDEFCHFKCVQKDECGSKGSMEEATIADAANHICRRCAVEGCLHCEHGEPGEDIEKCNQCMPGYILKDGECHGVADKIFLGIAVACAVGVVLAMLWLVNLICRPDINGDAVWPALVNRHRTKFYQRVKPEGTNAPPVGEAPAGEATAGTAPENAAAGDGDASGTGVGVGAPGARDTMEPYPITTNLCGFKFMAVAGPGTTFFFQFQMALIVWAIVLWVSWLALGFGVSTDLFVLGTKPAETPQKMCSVIQWGRKRQMELIWVKVSWLAGSYVFSFISAMIFASRQHKTFNEFDQYVTTQCDFCALCTIVPTTEPQALQDSLSGEKDMEESFKTQLQERSGEEVVGVSICWDYHHDEHAVLLALEEDLGGTTGGRRRSSLQGRKSLDMLAASAASAEAQSSQQPAADGASAPAQAQEAEAQPGCLSRICNSVNRTVLEAWKVYLDKEAPAANEQEHAHAPIDETLKKMKTTQSAFVVFASKDSCDRAVAKSEELGGLEYSDGAAKAMLVLEHESHEPQSVLFENFGVTKAQVNANLAKGIMIMILSLVFWTLVLYAPYAHYMGSFSYANGDEPSEIAESVFVGIVVAAQVGLFVAASMVAKHAGFRYEDAEQRMYIILYNSALFLNLALDMLLTGFLSYHQMTGRGVHVADGRLLSELPSMQEIIESYPMQKSMGHMLFKYCWPATFFLPFACEPLGICWLPYFVGKLFIRSDKRITGPKAEKALEVPVMEQGRYADCMFNVILASLVPFLAPGYMHKVFGFLVFSQIFIYCYDHWKTLRCVTRFYFASDETSRFAQKLFAVPCGFLLSGLVFKANQMSGKKGLGSGVLQGYTFWAVLVATFFGHIMVHLAALEWATSSADDYKEADDKYENCAREKPATWFSCNPVHVLRSKHIKKDQPHQVYFVVGKEHLLNANPKIGSYYEEEAPQCEAEILGL